MGAGGMSLENVKILMVDDEPEIVELISTALGLFGAEVLSAASGNAAQKVLDDSNVDIIISDIRMPDGDGISLLKAVRSRHETKPAFLFLSGFSDVTTDEANKMGAQGRFFKPMSVHALIKEIEKVLKTAC
jgi:DNA-binding NtrC family response regulator